LLVNTRNPGKSNLQSQIRVCNYYIFSLLLRLLRSPVS